MGCLEEKLKAYAESGIYPLHMPGHKRRISATSAIESSLDFTEVKGTDDLHHADGILKEAMQRTAGLYGAARTWYLVNGSTCGNLAGIFSVARQNGEVIAARNCHRSVFHALQLRNCHVHWASPEWLEDYEIYGSVRPEVIEGLLKEYPESSAVILTSPTYEGILSDIRSIAGICHAHHIPLLVDEAHGAHLFKGDGFFPEGAVSCGADLVVQSPHKTLLSVTQTSWLHLSGDLVNEDTVEKYLGIFESSSPSYPLLMSLDGCTQEICMHGTELYRNWCDMLKHFHEMTDKKLSHLQILKKDDRSGIYALDPSRILIRVLSGNKNGIDLQDILRDQYHFETEMAEGRNVLAMTSMADDPVQIDRFARALLETDACMPSDPMNAQDSQLLKEIAKTIPEQRLTLLEADSVDHENLPAEEAEGHIAGEYVYCYPPGIPMIMPGEAITSYEITLMQRVKSNGYRAHFTETENMPELISVCRQDRRI